MKLKVLLGALGMEILLVSCMQDPAEGNDKQLYSQSCSDCGFDTFFALQQMDVHRDAFPDVFQEASSMFRHYNDLFDIYHSYEGINNLKTVNDMAGIRPVEVDPEIIDLLKTAEYCCELTDGKMDVTMGALLQVWHAYREEGLEANAAGNGGAVPETEELKTAASLSGWDHVIIDEEKQTVYLTEPGMSLDIGALAKGYAVERIAGYLLEEGYGSGAVNGGGNTRILGPMVNGRPWRIGIQDPRGEGAIVTILWEDAVSVVTSGDYERFYTGTDGRVYHHIIDPVTCEPARTYHSVTIITERSDLADALSTALFTMTLEEGNALLETLRNEYPGIPFEAVWIMDGSSDVSAVHSMTVNRQLIIYTEGLEGKLAE